MASKSDAEWYLSVRHRFCFSPLFKSDCVEYDFNGCDWMKAYVAYDTHGKRIKCRHPRTLAAIIRTKGAVNFMIKEWAASLAHGYLLKDELLEYLSEINAPGWVLEAAQKQRYKMVFEGANNVALNSPYCNVL